MGDTLSQKASGTSKQSKDARSSQAPWMQAKLHVSTCVAEEVRAQIGPLASDAAAEVRAATRELRRGRSVRFRRDGRSRLGDEPSEGQPPHPSLSSASKPSLASKP